MPIVKHLTDVAQGKANLGSPRSSKWPAVREAHLKLHPVCEVCGGAESLEVHHKEPFHLNPTLELNPDNLITLCESKKMGVNCHLFVGHLGNFKSFNATVADDAAMIRTKLQNRPQPR